MKTHVEELDRIRTEYRDRKKRLSGKNIYSLFNTANLFITQQRQRDLLRLLRRHGFSSLRDQRLLEIGCGGGEVLLECLNYEAAPASTFGIDLLPDRVAQALEILPHMGLVCGNGQFLPYPSGTFDLVLQFTVFSSILDETIREDVAQEMIRVLKKPDGMILWYDFWLNPINKQTRGVRPPEIRRLFPNCQFEFHRVTLAPPIARRLVPLSWGLAYLLENSKFLNTHYLVAIRPATS